MDSDDSGDEAEIWKVCATFFAHPLYRTNQYSQAIQATNPDLNPDEESPDYSDSDSDEADTEFEAEEVDADDAGEAKVESESEEDNDDGSQLSLVEDSDGDDLIGLDDVEVPDGLIEYESDGNGGSDVSAGDDADGEWTGLGGESKTHGKRKRGKVGEQGKKRRRALPTFATYEDYAKLIEEGPEDDI